MTYRFAAIVVAAMFLAYACMQWFLGVRQTMPSAKIPLFHQIDPVEYERTKFNSDNDDIRDELRRAVQNSTGSLLKSPCNDYLRDQYIAAATKYARAHLSIAPCLEKNRCNSKKEVAQMELAYTAFKTRFDETVQERMYEVHRTGTIRGGDFEPDVVGLVALMTKDIAINPNAPPAARRDYLENRAKLSCRP